MSFSKLWDNLKPLTRLPGFRSPRCIKSAEEFLQILKSERARADRYSHAFSLALFHLENMDSSDDKVKRLSHVIARRVRYTDQVGWLDRHSFTVLLPDTSTHDARKLAHEISNAIAETDSPPAFRVYTYPIYKYQSIINRFGSPAVITDYVEKILVVNDAMLKFSGLSESGLLGQGLCVLEDSTVDLTERAKRLRLLDIYGYYDGYMVLRSPEKAECLMRLCIDRTPNKARNGYLINRFVPLNHNKLEEYKDLVLVKNEIHQNMGKITDINQLTKNLNLNYRVILSLFKQYEDTTLKSYLIDMKIERCIEMMRTGKYTFKKIASELGFCDLSHLSSVFKEKMKVSLSEYKKTLLSSSRPHKKNIRT